MTVEEAIKELRKICKAREKSCRHVCLIGGCEVEKAIEALKKQIPKKPIWHNDTTYLKCSVCGSFDIGDGYCGDCGQKIDWSEE